MLKLIPTVLVLSCLTLAACSDDSNTADSTQDTSNTQSIVSSTLSNFSQETSEGADIVRKRCVSCHYTDQYLQRVGPSLKGIYGKKVGIADMPFDTWTEENLDRWLASPREVKPRTKMAIPGIEDANTRTLIIEYLKGL